MFKDVAFKFDVNEVVNAYASLFLQHDIALNSNEIKQGDIFVALQGAKSDGHKFISDAIARGASLVLCEDLAYANATPPVIAIKHLREHLPYLAQTIYPLAKDIEIIGVTGTNGKTSTCYFVYQALGNLGIKAGYIGTIGVGCVDYWQDNNYTTPDIFGVYRALQRLYEHGVKMVAMEVTSHALEQGRVLGLNFSTAAFTNLTHDHLDYHLTMENYGLAKRKLFTDYGVSLIVLNAEDEYSNTLLATVTDSALVYFFGENKEIKVEQGNGAKFCFAQDVKYLTDGIVCTLVTAQESIVYKFNFLGKFNLSNLLTCISILLSKGFTLMEVLSSIKELKPVPGRMQSIKKDDCPLVIIDYAHTPDALLKVLNAIRAHCLGKIYCVFGCGGDRDLSKRSIMGSIATQYADTVVVTSDNPRTEDPMSIINQIMQGITREVIVEPNRSAAIALAISLARVEDVVLVAGKGHENYQIIGNTKFNYSDEEEVLRGLNVRREAKRYSTTD